MASKITKKDFYGVISNVFGDMEPDASFSIKGKGAVTAEQVIEFAEHQVAQLDKKASGERKPTAKQVESAKRREAIKTVLTGEGQTIADIQAATDAPGALSGHQISALLSPMVADGEVVRSKVKGVTYFALAGAVSE